MSLYEEDFYKWTKTQAELLKAGRLAESDIENILEEIESLGRYEERMLKQRLTKIFVHLLKWQVLSGARCGSWKASIWLKRDYFNDLLEDSPSLADELPDVIPEAYESARLQALSDTGLREEWFPVESPWAIESVLDQDFFPDDFVIPDNQR